LASDENRRDNYGLVSKADALPVKDDSPDDRDRWNTDCRQRASDYLKGIGISHGRIGEIPAWSLAPHVSLWAIESGKASGKVGWWAICGDCPTDYVSCTGDRTPRSAIEQFATRWQEAAVALARGEQHPDFVIGDPENAREVAPLLAARAELLRKFALDDALWDYSSAQEHLDRG
jgi:Domain of unknown function (DUF4826)